VAIELGHGVQAAPGAPRASLRATPSSAPLRVRHIDAQWGLRNVSVKGGTTRDIPLPAVVTQFLQTYVDRVVASKVTALTHDTPLFWSEWGRRHQGKTQAPMEGKSIWPLCKTYGRLIGYPMLKPHDLRHGIAREILKAQHDLEAVRAMLGHVRLETTQLYAQIRPRRAQARGGVLRSQGARCARPVRRTDEGRRGGFESRSTACFSRVRRLRA
jgi:integrase